MKKKTKMGKSKIRKIVVNDVEYYWTVYSDYGYYGCYDENITCHVGLVKQRNHRFSFTYNSEITPSLIREAIEFANKRVNWQHTKTSIITSNFEGFSYSRYQLK